ncbi:RagB/SusD family nutrient uptake outer membrane protein [Chitinophaga sp. SYP-B3965]|uniref:RagB/SusD family nutrient uptake outer membrane protein n=1 Tax=Chitinophaga sp. SYP-B3965 TaxID=2663120 RepID=UPI0012995829|nr:RagB/SusD family nutrient uptake outer membrane protein [Chitinophaga sp. SYP-B3965]MRG48462.1 RagB/SusD family nutrient uptake outer membrane protein [Chitinophaga sp. SYP-B3965]
MQKLILLLILFLAVTSSFSCNEKWLDIKADAKQETPDSLEDFQVLLNNRIIINAGIPSLGEIASDGYYISQEAWLTGSNAERNAYTWSKAYTYYGNGNWQTIYYRIFTINLILEELHKLRSLSGKEKEEFNNIKGQALFNRASAFYFLAQTYAPVFNWQTLDKDPGIPLKLSTDLKSPTTRASLRETYERILLDTKEAASLLPNTVATRTGASKAAAYGLLSRIYLSSNRYDSAFSYADKALKISGSLLNYNYINTENGYMGALNGEVIYHETMYATASESYLTTQYLIDPDLYDLYDEKDLRKTIFFRRSGPGITFKGNYNDNSTELYCGIATDELYLTRAECYARSGNLEAAMQDLNFLLENRWKEGTFKPLKANTEKNALDLILTERRKELILRGSRWTDLRRLNKDPRFRKTITRTVAGIKYTLEPNSYKYTLPLPDDIIAQTGMKQNEGW